MNSIRLVLADQRPLFRAAMQAALGSETGLSVMAVVADTTEAIDLARSCHAHVVLLSDRLTDADAPSACAAIKAEAPATRVIVLADAPDDDLLQGAIEAGADGYLTLEAPLPTVAQAIRHVAHGGTYVPLEMLGVLVSRFMEQQERTTRAVEMAQRLTRREREVLGLLADGCDADAVSDVLWISPQTARTHIHNTFRKLGVHSRLEAAAMAIEYGVVAPSRGVRGGVNG